MGDDGCGRHRATRQRLGLRADPEWVDWVAEHGSVPPMLADIPMTDHETRGFEARQERATSTIAALHAAGLASAAGAWLDHRAGGVVRLLLAHPDVGERAVAKGIVAEHGGIVEFVEHSTRELDAVRELIHAEIAARSPFGQAVTSAGSDVWANAERVTLRGDLHPEIPAVIQAAVEAGRLLIEHPSEPLGWERDEEAARGAGPASSEDEPMPAWPGEDGVDPGTQLNRCVHYVADRCVGGPLATAHRLAEDIGLSVRVIYPGSAKTLDLRSDRINYCVNADYVVRRIDAG